MADGDHDHVDTRGRAGRYYGKYAGIVVDNAGRDSGEHRGEVTVQVPGILEETPDGLGNQPLQLVAAPALPPGFFFVPDPAATVWVEFVDGDIANAVWSGAWYAQDGAPKDVDGAAPTLDHRIIRSRSGQVILFDDSDGAERLVVKDEKNMSTITLDKNGITIVAKAGIAITYQPDGGTAATLSVNDQGIVASCGQSSLTVSDQQIALSRPAVTLTVASTVDVS